MLRMCICLHFCFVGNHPIRILEDGPLISEVVLSQRRSGRAGTDTRLHREGKEGDGVLRRAHEGGQEGKERGCDGDGASAVVGCRGMADSSPAAALTGGALVGAARLVSK
jgi:hypothetical protein